MSAHTKGTAVVTGGTQGIGLAIAQRLAADGYRVAVLARGEKSGREAVETLGRGHAFVRCDVSQEEQIQPAIAQAEDLLGPIAVLVNNAGVGHPATADSLTSAEWDALMSVDLKAAWLTARAAMPGMRSRGGGSIVNIASIHAHLTRRGLFPYAAAKAGMLGLTRSLALELAESRIRVNAVCPGYVRTPPMVAQYEAMHDPEQAWQHLMSVHPLGRIGEPEDVAAVVAFLASDDAGYVTGASWDVDGGLGARFAT